MRKPSIGRRLVLIGLVVAMLGFAGSSALVHERPQLVFENTSGETLNTIVVSVQGRDLTRESLPTGGTFSSPVDDSKDIRISYSFRRPGGNEVNGKVGFAGGERAWKYKRFLIRVRPGAVVEFDAAKAQRDWFTTAKEWLSRLF